MEFSKRCLVLLLVGVIWSCVLGLQRPPPRYSQQYMPDTSFSCRNKIVGSYYADPETDCQLFHVCVSVAGSIQDYKFLCPNDTAFDQESQTCADWYDVDCEASTLYYASDNFDLYRIGSGLESLHYDSLRSDAEPQDHLQRSESNDPVRSSANSLNRVSNNNYNNNNNNGKDLLRSSNNNFYNSKNKDKTEEYETEKYKDENDEPKKKSGVRKVSRKQSFNNGNGNNFPTSTVAPTPNNQNTYNGFYSNNNYNQRQNHYATSTSTTTTTIRPQQDYRSQTTQRFNPVTSSTYRPTTNYQETYNTYQSPSTTARTTSYAYNVNPTYSSQTPQSAAYNNQQSTTLKTSNNNYNPNPTYDVLRQSNAFAQSTTLRPIVTYNNNRNYQDQSYNTNNNNNQYTQSTTIQPSTNYQSNDFAYQQRNYNNILRTSTNNGVGTHQSTTPAATVYDTNYNTYNNNKNNNKNGQYRSTGPVIATTTIKPDIAQTTARYYPTYAVSNGYTPTTYSPNINKDGNNRKFESGNNNQYYEKSSNSVAPVKSSTQYYDSTKAPKKATQYNNYDANGKYYETSTSSSNNYDYSRSVAAGIGFSPASINHLAETPRSTTPVPRRIPPVSNPTTYNPNSFSSNAQRSISPSSTTPRSSNYVSGSARPFSSTTRFAETTTPKPSKTGKKNDYDYAYYDNGAPLEYDGLDLEHVTGNKESSKIARSSN